MDNIKKQDNEKFLQYAKRLLNGKKDGLYDIDYVELYELLFNKIVSSDEARKRSYMLRDVLEMVEDEEIKNINNDDSKSKEEIIDEIYYKKIELQKERIKLSSIRNDLSKKVRDTARDELIFEEIRNAITNVKDIEFKPLHIQKTNSDYLLCFADIHYASFFVSENNEYNIDILHKRMEILLGNIIDFIKNNNVSKLYIANLGDSLQGLIRISDLKKLQIGLMQSVIEFARFMGNWLNELSKYVEIEYHHVMRSNHCELRLFTSERSDDNEDLEMIIANYIHDILKNNERINVVLSKKDYNELNLQGYEIFLAHGHQFRKKNIFSDLCVRNKKFYDTVILGHYHSVDLKTNGESENSDMETIVVGSIVGSDTYSDSLLLGSKSSALMLRYDSDKGRTLMEKFILN